jgi:hypothetical protein
MIAGFQMTLAPETGYFPIPFRFAGLCFETLIRLAGGVTVASRPQFSKKTPRRVGVFRP